MCTRVKIYFANFTVCRVLSAEYSVVIVSIEYALNRILHEMQPYKSVQLFVYIAITF